MTSPPSSETPLPGVRFLEHTADVGLEATATDPAELFRRAGVGMMHLLVEGSPPPARERTVTLRGSDLAILLRSWLRELLRWHEDGFTAADLRVDALARDSQGEWHLSALVLGDAPIGRPLREIKGVTLHGLAAEPREAGWYARVVFDV